MNEIREEEGISLLDIFNKVKQHIVFIIISIVMCVGAMGFYSVVIKKPQFVARSSVMMSSNELAGQSGLNYSLSIVETYEEFLQSRVVREEALRLAQLPKNTQYSLSTSNNGTLIVYISVTSYDDVVSMKLANAFIEAGTNIISTSSETSMKALKIASPYLLDEATSTSTSRGLVKNCVIGFALGAIIACAYIFLRMLIDNTYTKPEEIENDLGVSVLAITPYVDFDNLDGRKSIKNLLKKK